MPEKIEELIRQAIAAAQKAGDLASFEVEDCGVERPADADNGDWTSTVALRSARLAHAAPAKIAAAIVAHMPEDKQVSKVEVAGPGFINFYLNAAASNDVFRVVREAGADWGKSNVGNGLKMNYEFISANPTGPLHVGHGRWVALGDSMCNIFDHTNFKVDREYYINDHGSQMDVFGSSVATRYLQLVEVMRKDNVDVATAQATLLADREAYVEDEMDEHPEQHPYMDAFNEILGGNSYGGDYIIDIAREFYEADGDKWYDVEPEVRTDEFRERAYQAMLSRIKATCHQARCDLDLWFSERTLYIKDETGTSPVDRAFAKLDKMGYLYKTDDGALWFKSTAFGDDKDRVLIKSNGEYTYFASDVAYHWDKFQRDDYSIDLWGADHHGYIARVTNVCDALGYPGKFEVDLGQFVNLLRNGEPVRMSKRRGTMVSFQELLDEVGTDATRYTLVSKSSNQTIDFDIEAAKKQESSNPVFYVQYAHARICSILRRAAGVNEDEARELGMDVVANKAIGADYDLSLLTEPSEAALARKISEFPELVASCARDRAPFRLTHFCEELAASFHGFYQHCQVLPSEGRPVDPELSRARLAAIDAVRINLAIALKLIGVSAPEVM
ncbi:arginine--tRNA ligase [Atopobium sp. oral taxon 810]|uniref:arginine--tRNA ligase n=1 Tax=Atopobium sp. oral taxon 810 TaxID=712158 RepID=UPI000396EFEC|nr:arginine--tRNA ligase [Atopobium sp. oral taxon 810]ERI05668.1 arginine--tRNA ligase [Atopobium sp. oral taxon 810 str. F0209]